MMGPIGRPSQSTCNFTCTVTVPFSILPYLWYGRYSTSLLAGLAPHSHTSTSLSSLACYLTVVSSPLCCASVTPARSYAHAPSLEALGFSVSPLVSVPRPVTTHHHPSPHGHWHCGRREARMTRSDVTHDAALTHDR